jgi:hypothetical protein
MNEVYRGHDIVVLPSRPLSAIIIERNTGAALPTKVIALPDEGQWSCLHRARQLVDLYLDAPSRR